MPAPRGVTLDGTALSWDSVIGRSGGKVVYK
jgi:hypothetical protein